MPDSPSPGLGKKSVSILQRIAEEDHKDHARRHSKEQIFEAAADGVRRPSRTRRSSREAAPKESFSKKQLRMVTRDRNANRRAGAAARKRRGRFAKCARAVARWLGFSSTNVNPRTIMAAQLIAQRIRGQKPLTLRERLFLILDEPSSSALAHFVSLSVTSVTLVATFVNTVETVRDPHSILGVVAQALPFDVIRNVTGTFFVTEALLRVSCYIPFNRVFLDPFIWLDCLTPLPFLFGLFFGRLPVLEAWGSIRLLKLCRYYEGAGLLARAFRLSIEQLGVPLFFLATMVVCCSSVLYQVEFDANVQACAQHWRDEAGLPEEFLFANPGGVSWGCDVCASVPAGTDGASGSQMRSLVAYRCATCAGHPAGHPECQDVPFAQQFQSIPHAMWFLIVTVSTVGFGDVSPVTPLGQLYISAVILMGILFLAMPLSVVGNNFQQVWDDRTLYKLQALTRQMLSENDMSPDDCITAFKQFDVDGDGLVDEKEFAHFVVGVLGLQLKKPELVKLWAMLDANKSGTVNFAEFAEMLFPDHKFKESTTGDEEAADGEKDKMGEHTFKLRQAASADTLLAVARDGGGVIDSDRLATALSRDVSCAACRPPGKCSQNTSSDAPAEFSVLGVLGSAATAAFRDRESSSQPDEHATGAASGSTASAAFGASALTSEIASAVASAIDRLGHGGLSAAITQAVSEQMESASLAQAVAERLRGPLAADLERIIERSSVARLGASSGTSAGATEAMAGQPVGMGDVTASSSSAAASNRDALLREMAASIKALEASFASMQAHRVATRRRSRKLNLVTGDEDPSVSGGLPSRQGGGSASFIRQRLARRPSRETTTEHPGRQTSATGALQAKGSGASNQAPNAPSDSNSDALPVTGLGCAYSTPDATAGQHSTLSA